MTTIATHDGKFHADDVFAVSALLLTVGDDAEVIRTRDSGKLKNADYVVDVGGISDSDKGRFDHHQAGGAGARGNNIPYAAFGLVWKKFGDKLSSGDVSVAKRVDEVLVAPIDANDNGINLAVPNMSRIFPYDISDAIRAFIPTWLEDDIHLDERFKETMFFAKRIIELEIKRAEAVVAGEMKVKELYQNTVDKRLIALPGDYSWKDTLAQFKEPLFVVHPQDGTWRLYCVRDNSHIFKSRKDLPEHWAGLRDAELANITGVPDATFCHRNRFMAVASSREGVLALAKLALLNS